MLPKILPSWPPPLPRGLCLTRRGRILRRVRLAAALLLAWLVAAAVVYFLVALVMQLVAVWSGVEAADTRPAVVLEELASVGNQATALAAQRSRP